MTHPAPQSLIRSKDRTYTVTPETLASNLIVMGSVPPSIRADEVDVFTEQHGPEYSGAFFAALAGYGIRVDYTNSTPVTQTLDVEPDASHDAAQALLNAAEDALNEVNKHVNHTLYPEWVARFARLSCLMGEMYDDDRITARH